MTHILTFLKAPRAGFVKTRLASEIGDERALATYQALVERQMAALPSNVHVEVHFTPTEAQNELSDWLVDAFTYIPQSEGGLGVRLEDAVRGAFDRGADKVICIGGDCPDLEGRHIEEAEQSLDKDIDVVFGPSEDGGYYLIALSSPQPGLFQDIPWSQPDTLKASIRKAEQLGLKVGLLETLYDVDEAKELDRAIAEGRIKL